MLALAIHYLNGWAMAAADGAKKETAEWPPHPDRVFMALAAAWFETDQDSEEGAALRWLESLPPPGIAASCAESRQVYKGKGPIVTYVPVNDSRMGTKLPAVNGMGKLKDAGLCLLPEHRSRQPRSFPVAIPHDPVVRLLWCDMDPGEHREALTRLARKVTSVGHSASLVQAWLEDAPPEPVWLPVKGVAAHRLRITGPGRLDYLEARCNRRNVIEHADLQVRVKAAKGKEKKMLQAEMETRFGSAVPVSLPPEPGRWQGYGRKPDALRPEIPGSLFDPNLVILSLSGKRVGLHSTLKLTETVRGALLSGVPEPIPEWLSGHTPSDAPTALPHIALLPLPFVGHEHADGRLMGLALALPSALNPAEVSRCLEPWLRDESVYGQPRTISLFAGKWFECKAELETRESPPASLRAQNWTRPSRTWASVTPVVLDRHYDGKDKWDQAAETVKEACTRIGLPRPREVLLHPVSLVEGVPHAREFPHMLRKRDGGKMHHAHAVIVFDDLVRGPVMVGAGRFRGYGLCRPMDRNPEDNHG